MVIFNYYIATKLTHLFKRFNVIKGKINFAVLQAFHYVHISHRFNFSIWRNIFIDGFKKLIGDVRSIDPTQVPTDVNLMGVLKEAVFSEQVLWGHLQFTDNITLDKMLEIISKWK